MAGGPGARPQRLQAATLHLGRDQRGGGTSGQVAPGRHPACIEAKIDALHRNRADDDVFFMVFPMLFIFVLWFSMVFQWFSMGFGGKKEAFSCTEARIRAAFTR